MSEVLVPAEALIGAVLLVLLVFVVVTLVRRRLIARDAELALCILAVAGGRSRTGMMRMTTDTLEWYRLFGVTSRASHRWPRRALDVGTPVPVEDEAPALALLTSSVRVPVDVRSPHHHDSLVLVTTLGSYTAFRAWAEAAPPSFPVSG